MKDKKTTFILILGSILLVCFIGSTLFLVFQGISAQDKQHEYHNLYRAQAKEYIESDPEIREKYGEDISVEFGSYSYTYSEKRRAIDRYIEVFFPWKPETVEEFNAKIDAIRFNVKINDDPYEIILEKNENGELSVTGLTESKE